MAKKILQSICTAKFPELGRIYTGQELMKELLQKGFDKEEIAAIGAVSLVCRSTNNEFFTV